MKLRNPSNGKTLPFQRRLSASPASPDPRPFWFDRVAALAPRALLGGAVVAFLGFSLVAIDGESATYDEGTHLAAGYSYWARRDFRLNPEHPPLLKLVSALPLLLMRIEWPSDVPLWQAAAQEDFGFKFLYQSGNDPDRMLFWARVFALPWGALLLVSIYTASRKRFGPRGALVSLSLATACPILLAHGHLVTTDVIAAFLIFVTVQSFWRLLKEPDPWRALGCGALLGCALLSKYTAVALAPILLLLVPCALLAKRFAPEDPAPEAMGNRGLRSASALAILVLTAYGILWVGYGCRFKPSPDPDFAYAWERLPEHRTLTRRFVDVARSAHFLPEAYLYGLAKVDEHNNLGHGTYAWGRRSTQGWWWYFPFAFLVKTPLSTLLLMGWGALIWCRWDFREKLSQAPLVVPILVLGTLALTSRINIGIRHLYPLYPYLLVLAGGIGLSDSAVGWRTRAVSLLVALGFLDVLLAMPHWLAYFNLPSRILFERHELLVDSNLDWGQDLARLKKFMDRHGVRSIKMSYFGAASPRHLKLAHESLPGLNLYEKHEPEWPRATVFKPGDWVAISATNLAVLYLDDRSAYRAWFSQLAPVATLGHSIHVYRIPEYAR